MTSEDATPAEMATAEVHQQARRMRLTVQAGVVAGLVMLAAFGIYSVVVLVKVTDTLEKAEEAARVSREASLTNRRLIERGNPCLPGDPPESEACAIKRESDARLAGALAAVQAQHDEQAQQVDDAVARLVELQERQHGIGERGQSGGCR